MAIAKLIVRLLKIKSDFFYLCHVLKDALYLLVKFGYHLLFIVLEIICFYLIVTFNKDQKNIFINSTNIFTTKLNTRVDKFEQYLALQTVNDSLQKENALLIKKFLQLQIEKTPSELDTMVFDSFQYEIIPSSICNSTINLANNNVTLCSGSIKGMQSDMGVISNKGLVGIITNVTENYSNVMSLLNNQTMLSCAIKRNKSHGTLIWKGSDPKIMYLIDIPKHLSVIEGDTVVTSGYSTMFPKGIMVGKVKSVVLEPGKNSFTIKVELFNDPSNWDVVYVIRNNLALEQKKLEMQVQK